MRATIVFLPFLLAGCAAPPPTPVAKSSPPAPTARVTAVEPSRESVLYARVKVVFENLGPHACQLLGYTLIWGSARKKITLESVAIPAGESRERWIRIDEDISGLTAEGARVEVEGDCSQ